MHKDLKVFSYVIEDNVWNRLYKLDMKVLLWETLAAGLPPRKWLVYAKLMKLTILSVRL